MFLKPEQQLERCKRIVRQRVDPHIHPSIAQLAVESFDIPGEPMPTDEFFEKLNRGDIDFKPFTLGGEWGTTWGTVWFRLTGTVPAGYPKRQAAGAHPRPRLVPALLRRPYRGPRLPCRRHRHQSRTPAQLLGAVHGC